MSDSNNNSTTSSLDNTLEINVFKVGTNLRILSEIDIKYAMEHTRTNTEAADFLNVSMPTFKKYAEQYYNSKGESLYQANRKDPRKLRDYWTKEDWFKYYRERFREKRKDSSKKDMVKVLRGEEGYYDGLAFRERLISEGYKDKCDHCGFSTKRVIDDKIPLVLKYLDGNEKNKKLENLETLCLNCNFLFYGSKADGSKAKLREFYESMDKGQSKEETELDLLLESKNLNSSVKESLVEVSDEDDGDEFDWED